VYALHHEAQYEPDATWLQTEHEVHEPTHVYAEHHEKHVDDDAGAEQTAQPWQSSCSDAQV